MLYIVVSSLNFAHCCMKQVYNEVNLIKDFFVQHSFPFLFYYRCFVVIWCINWIRLYKLWNRNKLIESIHNQATFKRKHYEFLPNILGRINTKRITNKHIALPKQHKCSGIFHWRSGKKKVVFNVQQTSSENFIVCSHFFRGKRP